LISVPSLGVYYCQQVIVSVFCLCVTPLQIASSFLFLDEIVPFFGRQFSMWHSTKRCSSILDLRKLHGKAIFAKKSNLLLFCFSVESSHFWLLVLHDSLYKTLFLHFWFRAPNAQNLLPKICTTSPISRLVWQMNWRCLVLPGGFRGWPIQWNHAKCCGADPCCHGYEISATCGDPVAYWLV